MVSETRRLCFIASCTRMEEGGAELRDPHITKCRVWQGDADRMASEGLWCRHVFVPFSVQAGRPVKRGLGQPYTNLVRNWSRSPEEPMAGRNQYIVPVRRAGLRGEAPHGPPERVGSPSP
ncbi:hypothetical protein HAX54_051187 [Datura stramonium]|uniref:Uncharacterized protein n=1 Tax=Datura stramonium TaxID=4076 RepID=A0ABS8WPF3_DATST|nr:hypothetical protein [Datura stramonium]